MIKVLFDRGGLLASPERAEELVDNWVLHGCVDVVISSNPIWYRLIDLHKRGILTSNMLKMSFRDFHGDRGIIEIDLDK